MVTELTIWRKFSAATTTRSAASSLVELAAAASLAKAMRARTAPASCVVGCQTARRAAPVTVRAVALTLTAHGWVLAPRRAKTSHARTVLRCAVTRIVARTTTTLVVIVVIARTVITVTTGTTWAVVIRVAVVIVGARARTSSTGTIIAVAARVVITT